MKRVSIVGTGLVGGSFALALRRAFPEVRIAGIDKPDVLQRAFSLKLIDEAGIGECDDLVVLAAPVGEIMRVLEEIPIDTCLVTDVGSTKVAICETAAQRGLRFIGGHPMAGIELSGPESARADLFRDALFFLCPVESTPQGALEFMVEVIQAIGGIPHVLSPQEHDRLVAQISHLPQLLSSLLAEHTAENSALAGSGLRSMTRLAGSPFHVWRDIFRTSGFLPHELRSFIQRLQSALNSLEAGNFDEIEKAFKRGGSE